MSNLDPRIAAEIEQAWAEHDARRQGEPEASVEWQPAASSAADHGRAR